MNRAPAMLFAASAPSDAWIPATAEETTEKPNKAAEADKVRRILARLIAREWAARIVPQVTHVTHDLSLEP